jgi:hypothetical protein
MPRELSVLALASAMKEENTSGSDEPAAMSVAPAWSRCIVCVHMDAKAQRLSHGIRAAHRPVEWRARVVRQAAAGGARARATVRRERDAPLTSSDSPNFRPSAASEATK